MLANNISNVFCDNPMFALALSASNQNILFKHTSQALFCADFDLLSIGRLKSSLTLH